MVAMSCGREQDNGREQLEWVSGEGESERGQQQAWAPGLELEAGDSIPASCSEVPTGALTVTLLESRVQLSFSSQILDLGEEDGANCIGSSNPPSLTGLL